MATTKNSKDGQKDILYILTYLFTFLSGIIVFVTVGQKNARLKFHALQAIILGIVGFVLGFIPFIGGLFALVLWIYGIYVGYRAYEYNDDISVPVIGDFAK